MDLGGSSSSIEADIGMIGSKIGRFQSRSPPLSTNNGGNRHAVQRTTAKKYIAGTFIHDKERNLSFVSRTGWQAPALVALHHYQVPNVGPSGTDNLMKLTNVYRM
jgi:hypothetical protein